MSPKKGNKIKVGGWNEILEAIRTTQPKKKEKINSPIENLKTADNFVHLNASMI